MKSFIALYIDPASQKAAELALPILERLHRRLGLPAAQAVPGLAAFDLSPDSPGHTLHSVELPSGGAAHIYGALFRNSALRPQAAITSLTSDEAARLDETQGGSLLTDFWGSYVAFIQYKDRLFVKGDVAGSIPCYHLKLDKLHIFFSHLELCDVFDRTHLTINYGFLRRLLTYDKIQTGETGLQEVTELLPGMKWEVDVLGTSKAQAWDPSTVAGNPLILKDNEALETLRETTLSVVQSWANTYGSVTVSLSGGLDSSIILACLSSERWTGGVNAIHNRLVSEDPSEFRYAGMAADAARRRLFELPTPVVETLAAPEDHPLSARPHRSFGATDLITLAERHDIPLGAGILTGQGGDHLFLASDTPLGFADYLHQLPKGRRFSSELLSAARLSNLSVWEVLGQTIPYKFGRRPESSLLTAVKSRQTTVNSGAAAAASLEKALPSWAVDPRQLPPGKFTQVNHLFHMFQIRDVLAQPGRHDMLHPLISQPLIELCLRLPVYQLCLNGTNRGLAREAFGGILPEAIRLRVTKGNASRYYAETLERHLVTIAERLADGALVKAGLIRRDDVLQFVSADGITLRKWRRMALIYYSIECWLKRWSDYLQRS